MNNSRTGREANGSPKQRSAAVKTMRVAVVVASGAGISIAVGLLLPADRVIAVASVLVAMLTLALVIDRFWPAMARRWYWRH